MALSAPYHPAFSQTSVNDLGRCGFTCGAFNRAANDDDVAALAGQRLLAAALTGDVSQAVRCVADGADINISDISSGETAVHRAAQRNNIELLALLLSAGADPNRLDRAQRTPLFLAASAGHIPAVKLLLAHGTPLFPEQPDTSSSAGPASASPSASSPSTHEEADDAAFLALRSTCPIAAAAAAAHWPVVASLLEALPSDFTRRHAALRSLRFLVWALASHKAFPREVLTRLPRHLPRCVIDAVRPAYLASTPLVLATGNDQQQLMQWLLQQGADPELGAPLLLCAGRFCRGSRTCCVSTLLRRGARPHVAWADNPADSPLQLAARGDCFTHVHCLVAYGADVGGEAARVREALYAPPPWEAHLDGLLAANGALMTAPGADLLCPCGQQHASWPGLWPLDGEGEEAEEGAAAAVAVADAGSVQEGSGGNSCFNRTPSDDAWYRHHRAQMEQLQDGNELAECRRAVDDLWAYGCSAVVSELGGAPAAPHSLMPQRVLAAMQDVAGGWLVAAARCRQQRQLRAELYDKAVAAGRLLLERKRVAALAALGGVLARSAGGSGAGAVVAGPLPPASLGCFQTRVTEGLSDVLRLHCNQQHEHKRPGSSDGGHEETEELEAAQPPRAVLRRPQAAAGEEGLVMELRMEILALAGLAPPEVQPRAVQASVRPACVCPGCSH